MAGLLLPWRCAGPREGRSVASLAGLLVLLAQTCLLLVTPQLFA